MPLTKTGEKVLKLMQKRYGKRKGESVFYATMRKYCYNWERGFRKKCLASKRKKSKSSKKSKRRKK